MITLFRSPFSWGQFPRATCVSVHVTRMHSHTSPPFLFFKRDPLSLSLSLSAGFIHFHTRVLHCQHDRGHHTYDKYGLTPRTRI